MAATDRPGGASSSPAARHTFGISLIERSRERLWIDREALKPTGRIKIGDIIPPTIGVPKARVNADMATPADRKRIERAAIILAVPAQRFDGTAAA